MAFDNIGYSRDIPIAQNGSGGQSGPAGVSGISPQQAVKIFSLRVPEQPSQGSLAPLQLLNSPGGSAPGASALTSMIAALMQAIKPASVPTAGPTATPRGSTQPMVQAPIVGLPSLFVPPGQEAPSAAGGAAPLPPPHITAGQNGPPPPPLPPPAPPVPGQQAPAPATPPAPAQNVGSVAGEGPTMNPRFGDNFQPNGFLQALLNGQGRTSLF